MDKKIIGLIPARMGSSRFPGKPIAKINNMPMIYWVYEQAKKTEKINEIYVVTPDIEVKDVCNQFQIPCLYDAKQGNTAAQKLAYTIQDLDGDIYLNIQGDEPLLNSLALEQIIDELVRNDDVYYVGLRSKIKTENEHKDRNIVKAVVDNNDNAMYFSRSPIPPKFEYGKSFRVMGLYGYRDWFLKLFASIEKTDLENLESGIEMIRMLQNGYKIKLLNTEYDTIGVDLPEHIEMIEKEMNKIKLLRR